MMKPEADVSHAETDIACLRGIIANSRMGWRQWAVIVMMTLLNALDGFDVLSSAFAGPGIRNEFELRPDGLGMVLSMELAGMAAGSLMLGGVADKFGRRPMILGCLVAMAFGMFAAATAQSPQSLSVWRLMTGFGIGGMLTSINAVAFDYANVRWRNFVNGLVVTGYPLGAFLGGQVVAVLLKDHDWRAIFIFGGMMTAICIPITFALVPEPPEWLAASRRPGALQRINRTLKALGHGPLKALGAAAPSRNRPPIALIFSPAYMRTTLILSIGYAAHVLSFYYVLKMAPAIMSDPDFAGQSFSQSEGARILSYANLGGAIGGVIFGWLMQRYGIKRMTMAALGLSSLAIIHFGLGQGSLSGWSRAVILTGLSTNAAIVGFYAASTTCYPSHMKATGTGMMIGLGRGGAVLSPILAGWLFAGKMDLLTISMVMATGSCLALLLFTLLPLREQAC